MAVRLKQVLHINGHGQATASWLWPAAAAYPPAPGRLVVTAEGAGEGLTL
jgi:hypothetical protein